MNNTTAFRLIGLDEEENALFLCSFCGNVIPLESDGSGEIRADRIGDICPECGAYIERIEFDE